MGRKGVDGRPELFGALPGAACDGRVAEQPASFVGGGILGEVLDLLLERGDVPGGRGAGEPQRGRPAAGHSSQHAGLGATGSRAGGIDKLRKHRVGFGELAGLKQKTAGLQAKGCRRVGLAESGRAVGGERHLGPGPARVSFDAKSQGERLPDLRRLGRVGAQPAG